MSLSNAPGDWRWEQRGDKWWRIHDVLNIEDGPHDSSTGASWKSSQLAQLYYTWDELDTLATLIDERLREDQEQFGILNALRTSLREAQYSLERVEPN